MLNIYCRWSALSFSPSAIFKFMNREQLNALEEKIKKLREQLAEISGALVELQYDLKQKSSSS